MPCRIDGIYRCFDWILDVIFLRWTYKFSILSYFQSSVSDWWQAVRSSGHIHVYFVITTRTFLDLPSSLNNRVRPESIPMNRTKETFHIA